MAIPTREALSGFIVSDPQLTTSENGRQRFYARIGIEQSERGADGTYTELEPLFTDLVMFDKSAERALSQFQKGDHFIAEGRSLTRDYQGEPRDQFIASRIGHDNNLTTYNVDRSRRERQTPTAEATERKEIAPVSIGGAHPDQRHKERDQRGGAE